VFKTLTAVFKCLNADKNNIYYATKCYEGHRHSKLLFLQLLPLLLLAAPCTQRPPGRWRGCRAPSPLLPPEHACAVNLTAAATADSVRIRIISCKLSVFTLLDAILLLLLLFMLVLLLVPVPPPLLPALLLCCPARLPLLLPGKCPGCDAVEASNSRSRQVLQYGTNNTIQTCQHRNYAGS
jgi:hypothetical protein